MNGATKLQPTRVSCAAAALILVFLFAQAAAADTRHVVFVGGPDSHGYGEHEHTAGVTLLGSLLDELHDGITTEVHTGGWPDNPAVFDEADAVVIYADGGSGHPLLPHLDAFEEVMARGVGLVCLHFAVEPAEDKGRDAFLAWLGGYFETHWSVNPFWTTRDPELAGGQDHPIVRGVEPYEINDEWYYHMRFREDMEGIQPIYSALPPESSLERGDGPHSNNPHVREAILERGEIQHVAWAAERDGGGRGFGFTGGHYHWNWGHPMHRQQVLNAIAWAAHADVPDDGVGPGEVAFEDLLENLAAERPAGFDLDSWRDRFEAWNR